MKICVYGASSSNISRTFLKAGFALGQAIAQRKWTLVFGGGATGMMGAVVHGAESQQGSSIGVAPRFFDEDGILHPGCTQFIWTGTMRERKEKMEQLADAFIMTPGGIGTLEEFFEVLTLKQLKQLDKPICIYNVDGCFDGLNELLHDLVCKGFMLQKCLQLYYISDDIEKIMEYIAQHEKKEA